MANLFQVTAVSECRRQKKIQHCQNLPAKWISLMIPVTSTLRPCKLQSLLLEALHQRRAMGARCIMGVGSYFNDAYYLSLDRRGFVHWMHWERFCFLHNNLRERRNLKLCCAFLQAPSGFGKRTLKGTIGLGIICSLTGHIPTQPFWLPEADISPFCTELM